MKLDKKAKVGSGSIKNLLVVVVMATLFFAMAPSLVYTMSTGVADFLGSISGNSTLYGSAPSSIATILANNWGMFLIVGVLGLIISVVGGLFYLRRR